MKKLLMIFAGLFGLLVVAAVAIPFFVDVDKYRPQIVSAANEHLNGKLELGKLSLSLLGKIHIQVDGVQLSDSKGKPVLSVKEAYFHIPWLSVFSGSPEVIFKMSSPSIFVSKDASGKMNVMTLVKAAPESTGAAAGQAAPTQPSAPTAKSGEKTSLSVPGRLGLEMRDALVSYTDLTNNMKSTMKNLNLVVRNLSLTRTSTIEFWADLDTEMAKTKLKGPVRLDAKVTPEVSGGELKEIAAEFSGKFSDLEIEVPGSFQKKKGMKAEIEGSVVSKNEEVALKKLVTRFHTAEISASGKVSPKESQLKIASNTIELQGWSELIPSIRDYALKGSATLLAEVSGPNDKMNYDAKIKVDGLTARAPNLKAEPRIDATIHVVTDQLENLTAKVTAPGTDISMTGKVVSFTAPKFDFQLSSNGIDLDQLMNFTPQASAPSKSGKESTNKGQPVAGAARVAAAPSEDLDRSLDALRKNPVAASAQGVFQFQIKSLKAQQVAMNDLAGKVSMKDLAVSLNALQMKVFQGLIKSSGTVNMKPEHPVYSFGADVSGLSLQKAVESQLALFKNTVFGTANFKIDGSGSSFNTEPATKNLKAKGSFKVSNAVFTSIDIGKMITEGLNASIGKIGEKVPGMKGKTLKKLPSGGTEFEYLTSDFTISDGVFKMPGLTGKSVPNKGVDLKGDTTVNLIAKTLDARWEIIDAYNITGAKDISVDVAGTKVDSILAEKGKPVRFPISAHGPLASPQYSYTEVAEYLAKVAIGNMTGAASGRLKQEAAKQIQKLGIGGGSGGSTAPAPVQKALQGFGKKLFGH